MLQLEWYWVILIGTLIYASIGVIGAIIAPIISIRYLDPNSDKALIRLMSITTAICLWIFWMCVYLSQVYPLVAPEKNDSTGL